MQVSEKWHKDRMEKPGVDSLTDMKGNMAVGVDYLSELLKQYDDDPGAALMKYNGFKTAVHRRFEVKTYFHELHNIFILYHYLPPASAHIPNYVIIS